MADDLPTISTTRLPPGEVARRGFSTIRRGFDPDEVRAFLELIGKELASAEQREQELLHELAAAEERARHPVIDEGVLSSALGQRSAAVLRSAHEEAARITLQAEEAAAALLHEAQQQATETDVRGESVAAERIAEAELAANAMRQQAHDEATSVIEAARAEGDSLVERAREHGRAMVEQAQEARRRVLADMAQRRRAITDQIEQFRAARDEIASSIVAVRHSVDRIVDDLSRADDAARAAASDAARHQGRDAPEHVLVDEAEQAAAELGADTGSVLAEVPAAQGGSASRRVTLRFDDIASVVEAPAAERPGDERPGDERPGGATSPTVPERVDVAGAPGAPGDLEDLSPAPSMVSEAGAANRGPVLEELANAEGPALLGAGEHDHAADVENLFARLRARQAEEDDAHDEDDDAPANGDRGADPSTLVDEPADGVSIGATPAEGRPSVTEQPSQAGDDHSDAGGASAVRREDPIPQGDGAEPDGTEDPASKLDAPPHAEDFARREALLVPIVSAMARRLKRALQDDQNRLLDRLRQGTGEWSDALLVDEEVQRAVYAKASAGQVREAVGAGIAFARSSIGGRQGRPPAPDPATVDGLTAELAGTVVTLLRRRLEGTEVPDAAERIGAAYREWRGERIERLAEDRAIEAFGAGTVAGAGRSAALVWVRSETGPGCADCEDNGLAGALAPAEEFPTGHRHPPAHAGCRCLVLPVTRDSGTS